LPISSVQVDLQELTLPQKSAKQLAARNTARLNQTHLVTLAVHVFYILFRALFFRASFTKKSATLYVLLSAPALAVEYWLESIARPKYATAGAGGYGAEGAPRELKSAGEDLEAKGLTEYLWDVLYWTWACLAFVGAFGDRMWWFWVSPLRLLFDLSWTGF
jgi:SRP-independent targeting protein 2/TMEM208